MELHKNQTEFLSTKESKFLPTRFTHFSHVKTSITQISGLFNNYDARSGQALTNWVMPSQKVFVYDGIEQGS